MNPKGFAIIENAVKCPSVGYTMQLHSVAQEIGETECELISHGVQMKRLRKQLHAARRLSCIAVGLAVVSLVFSLFFL